MRYFFWKLHKPLIRNLIFFLMGVYTGLIIYLYFHGDQLDILYTKNGQLEQELADYKRQLDTYKEEEEKRNKKQVIRSVKFTFTEKLEPFNETELLKTLVEETHFLIGKKVEDVGRSPEFIYQLINNKIFKAKDKNYKIKVITIFIQSTIEIWVEPKEHNSG